VYDSVMLLLMLILPACAGGLAALARSVKAAFTIMILGVFCAAFCAAGIIFAVYTGTTVTAVGSWLYADALSSYHLVVMNAVFLLSTIFATVYFQRETGEHVLSLKQAKTFTALWCSSYSSMALVLVSNNLGIMWVGIEATTLLTAFLICINKTRPSLEAMWKYLIICSVGVAFAFMGTLLAAASTQHIAGLEGHHALLWTSLKEHASQLDPLFMKAAFIFLVVGYGTKAGLAPMHTWLPDAHSQAPAPVSAMFSGFMLNAALYCIMRYIPLTEAATGNCGWSLSFLTLLGLVSIGIGAAFIVFQNNIKRLLAYCSVEHIGIIALGLGFGGIGVFAALFHTFNHALAKTVSFCAAGRLGQIYGSHDIRNMQGTYACSRTWGIGLFSGLLALIGVVPFALFMSEFQIIKASVDAHATVRMVLFLAGIAVVFISMLRKAIMLFYGTPATQDKVRSTLTEKVLVFIPVTVLLVAGLWTPHFFAAMISRAAAIIGY
jgi:hydrogenase-4 component F